MILWINKNSFYNFFFIEDQNEIKGGGDVPLFETSNKTNAGTQLKNELQQLQIQKVANPPPPLFLRNYGISNKSY